MLETGKILQNRYRIEKQIGQGGMGAVYVAVDQRFGSTVAIKETLFLGENFEKAFEREARLLNSLRHPALPNVRDYFSEGKNQYLVMEFIPGEDLSEKLEKHGRAFDLEEVLNWSKQLLNALDFLHRQEIPVIHRDIKPQNLKLTPQGQIILLDFGLAKGNPTDASHLTNAKSIFGYSRNYASLEQMQGTGTDPRSDIYSLAATIYHLVTGNPPVDALTRAMCVLSEQADPLVPANQIHDQVSPGIANILQNALNLNANQRPSSAKELLEMLENSEEYADLENAQTVIANAVPTNLLNQDTQILPTENSNQTSFRTVRLSSGESESETRINKKVLGENYKTNVISSNLESVEKQKKRNPLYAIAAVLSLLMIAAGASAFYFFADEPRVSKENPTSNINAANNETLSQIKAVNTNTNSDNAGNVSNNDFAEKQTNSVDPPKSALKQNEQVKPKNDLPADKSKKSSQGETEMVIVDPEEGKVILKGDTIETDKVIVNDKGVIFKKIPEPPIPPPDGKPPVMPPDQLRRMTPRQRRRLNEIRMKMLELKKSQAEQNKVQAAPQPTP